MKSFIQRFLLCCLAGCACMAAGCSSEENLLDSYASKAKQVDPQQVDTTPPTNIEPSHDGTPPAAVAERPPLSDREFRDAAFAGKGEIVAQAINAGIDINSPDENGRTALMLAAYDGRTEIVKLLLKNQAQVNRRDAMNRTALTYSSSGKNAETVQVLLEAGADVDVVDNEENWTALMFACAEGNIEVVKLLLEHGANPLFSDEDGETPRQFAANNGHVDVVELLRQEITARKTR